MQEFEVMLPSWFIKLLSHCASVYRRCHNSLVVRCVNGSDWSRFHRINKFYDVNLTYRERAYVCGLHTRHVQVRFPTLSGFHNTFLKHCKTRCIWIFLQEIQIKLWKRNVGEREGDHFGGVIKRLLVDEAWNWNCGVRAVFSIITVTSKWYVRPTGSSAPCIWEND